MRINRTCTAWGNAYPWPRTPFEHCKLDYTSGFFGLLTRHRRTNDTRVQLATGGRPFINKEHLYTVTVTAVNATEYETVASAIAHHRITAAGWTPGSDNQIGLIAPDNATVDLTPVITGSPNHYHYSVSQQKHKLRLLANGDPCSGIGTGYPTPNFIVGQFVTFSSDWGPN